MNLIDIYNKRTDVQKEIKKSFPGQDPFKRGTKANTWLNNWYNEHGKIEHPGNLEKTLPSEMTTTPTTPTEMKSLPIGQLDNLSLLKLAMKDMSNIAKQKGIKGGLEATMGKLGDEGFAPEKVSGGMVGSIIDFVEKQVADPIGRQMETMEGILEGLDRKRRDNIDTARQNLNTIYNNIVAGNVNYDKLDAKTKSEISALERISGMPSGFFEALRDKNKTSEIIGTKDWTNENGEKYISVITRDPITGKVEIDNIYIEDKEYGVEEGMYFEDIEFNYNEKIDINKIPKLGGKQITNKTARASNLPYGITDKQADWIINHRIGNIQFQQLKSKDVKSMNDLIELREDINQVRALKEKVNTGPIAAKAGRAKRYVGWEDSDFNQLEIKTGKQLADFIKEISGAAVSEQEAQRLARLVPNIDMQDGQFITALDDLEDGLNGLISAKIVQFDLEDEDELIRAIRGEDDPMELFEGGGDPLDLFSTNKSGMRTDRHNNPTAFTTDIAKMALTEGVDYEEGDPFPNNPRYKTATLLGNALDLTIKVLNKIGFYTGSGKQRWTHTAMSKSRWDAMSYTEKKSVIKKMYQKEGNKGVLNNYFV